MRKPFWLIDGKLREAHFFLQKLRHANELDEARYYFSAFVSAARSVTYAIQVCLKDLATADVWWEAQRSRLKNDPIARYFHLVRNETNHTGLNPLQAHMRDPMFSRSEFLLAGDDKLPEADAVKAADRYMTLLVTIAREAFGKYWTVLDLPPDLTLDQLHARGKTFEDVEEELGMPRGWSSGISDEQRLHLLKQYSHTEIEHLSRQYPSN